jgi:hypothetical protein
LPSNAAPLGIARLWPTPQKQSVTPSVYPMAPAHNDTTGLLSPCHALRQAGVLILVLAGAGTLGVSSGWWRQMTEALSLNVPFESVLDVCAVSIGVMLVLAVILIQQWRRIAQLKKVPAQTPRKTVEPAPDARIVRLEKEKAEVQQTMEVLARKVHELDQQRVIAEQHWKTSEEQKKTAEQQWNAEVDSLRSKLREILADRHLPSSSEAVRNAVEAAVKAPAVMKPTAVALQAQPPAPAAPTIGSLAVSDPAGITPVFSGSLANTNTPRGPSMLTQRCMPVFSASLAGSPTVAKPDALPDFANPAAFEKAGLVSPPVHETAPPIKPTALAPPPDSSSWFKDSPAPALLAPPPAQTSTPATATNDPPAAAEPSSVLASVPHAAVASNPPLTSVHFQALRALSTSPILCSPRILSALITAPLSAAEKILDEFANYSPPLASKTHTQIGFDGFGWKTTVEGAKVLAESQKP